jgi:hypothetical protein
MMERCRRKMINNNCVNFSAGRILHDLDHTRSSVTTQQPSMSQNILRSSAENLATLGHQHPPHPHALSLGMTSQLSHVCLWLYLLSLSF